MVPVSFWLGLVCGAVGIPLLSVGLLLLAVWWEPTSVYDRGPGTKG
jgi:hypothetical protein